jgi:hypothetical protein
LTKKYRNTNQFLLPISSEVSGNRLKLMLNFFD